MIDYLCDGWIYRTTPSQYSDICIERIFFILFSLIDIASRCRKYDFLTSFFYIDIHMCVR